MLIKQFKFNLYYASYFLLQFLTYNHSRANLLCLKKIFKPKLISFIFLTLQHFRYIFL